MFAEQNYSFLLSFANRSRPILTIQERQDHYKVKKEMIETRITKLRELDELECKKELADLVCE